MSPRYDALPTELSVLSSDTLTSSYPGRLPRNILPPSHSYARLEATTSDSRSSLDSQDSYADEKEAVESELRLGGQSPGYRSRSNQARRFLRQRPYLAPFVALFAVILALALFLGAHSRLAARNRFSGHGRTPISMEHAFNGSLSYSFSGLHWIKSAGDGVYAAKNHQSGSIQLTDLTNNSTRQLVDGADLKDASGHRLVYTDYRVSPDMRYMLLATQVRSQWRHSFFAQYYVHHFDSKQTLLLVPQAKEADVAIASWAPQGHAIAFVRGNNVFIKQDPRQDDVIQVTDNGSDTFFNGIAESVALTFLMSIPD